MILPAIAQLLETAGLGVKAETIFVGAMPVSVLSGIRIWELPGTVGELPFIRRSDVQIIARGQTFPEAWLLANGVFEEFTNINQAELPGILIFSIRPLSQPFPFGREEGDAWHLAVNITATWRKED